MIKTAPQLDSRAPIGVFDSGMGGLTVLNALINQLPNEDFIYLGDTARLPYGTKSKETVIQYALHAGTYLVNRGIKLLVVACNTASSAAIDILRATFYPIPVVGVIEPGAKSALENLPNGQIAVIATEGTVRSQAYRNTILQSEPHRSVVEWPCSLLVALAEEGWHKGALVEAILKQILSPLWAQMDVESPIALLLGCTHFPVLKSAIENVIEQNVIVIDPAVSVASMVRDMLSNLNLLGVRSRSGTVQYLVTDGLERFERVGAFFMHANHEITDLTLISLDQHAPIYSEADKRPNLG